MSENINKKRIIVGISGASGVVYAVELLRVLRALGIETHLVISKTGQVTIAHETSYSLPEIHAMADHVHNIGDFSASISSGSFKTMGMIIAPCSVRSVAEIASGVTTTLLTRAADVTLKERRRLVLMVRETPLTSTHLRNMLTLSDMGAVIAPPVPAFYNKPENIVEIVRHSVARVLDLFDMEHNLIKRWQGITKS